LRDRPNCHQTSKRYLDDLKGALVERKTTERPRIGWLAFSMISFVVVYLIASLYIIPPGRATEFNFRDERTRYKSEAPTCQIATGHYASAVGPGRGDHDWGPRRLAGRACPTKGAHPTEGTAWLFGHVHWVYPAGPVPVDLG